MEHRQSRLATKEELDDFFNKIMREQQRQRRGKQKSSPMEKQDEEDVEVREGPEGLCRPTVPEEA